MFGKLRSDDDIARDVERALVLDARLDRTQVSTQVDQGIVRLVGYVAGEDQRALACRLAGRVAGVERVVDEIRVIPPTRSDVAITADAVTALTLDPRIDERTIEVVTVDGVVHLRGTVPDETIRKAAEDQARGVSGAQDVVNELLIAPPVQRTEEEIAADVRRRILTALRITPRALAVSVDDGIATLRGSVTSEELRMLADEVARWTPGVLDVRNELIVCAQEAA